MNTRALAVSLLAAVLIAGCGKGANKDALVGNWTGSAGMTYSAMQKDAAGENEQSRFLASQEMESKTIKLELKADGTAVFTNERIVNGTWTLEGDTVKLVLPAPNTGEEGKWFAGTYLLKLEGDAYMEGDDPNVEGYELRFKR